VARDLDFKKLVPQQWRRDAISNLDGFLDDIQKVFDDLLVESDRFPDILSIDRAPDGTGAGQGTTNFVDLLLFQLGNPFTFTYGMTTVEKRRIAALLVPLYKQKGTCVGIENAIRVLTGFESQCIVVSESFAAWQLDKSFLGIDTYLYGATTDLWGFEVWVNGTMTQTDRDRITAIINYMKPLEAKLTQLIQGSVRTSRLRFDFTETRTKTGLLRFNILP